MQQEQALQAQGATDAQLAAWEQQNAAQFAALQQQAQNLAASQPLASLPQVATVPVPAGATPEMTEFLQNRAVLLNKLAQLHNANLAAGTPSSMDAELQQVAQQNPALVQQQAQLAPVVAQQQAQKTVALPPPLQLPPNASPQMQAALTQCDALKRSRLTLLNQYTQADPSVRDAAFQQWEQQNAAAIQQMQATAQALSTSTQTQQEQQ